MSDFVIFLIAFGASSFLTGLVRRYALRRGVVDTPNDRSSHEVPTPRGGGLGIVIVTLTTVLLLGVFDELETKVVLAILFGGVLIAGIGFVDDHKHVPASWRFIAQIIAAVMVVFALGGLPDIQFGHRVIDLGLVGDFLTVFFMVWFTNLFNFMDGIDGIAASEAICIISGALLVELFCDGGVNSVLPIVIAAASLGFLVWNWPPAKIFMGDVGSAFLGFVLIAVAILTSTGNEISIWSWLILGSVFIVDASVTLLVRMLRKEDWLAPHRSHAYQHASRRFASHKIVTTTVVLINVIWLFPIAILASVQPAFGWWLTVLAWGSLAFLSLRLNAGSSSDV